MPALTLGATVNRAAMTAAGADPFIWTVTGAFRFDALGCSVELTEVIDGGENPRFVKVHTSSSLDNLDFSSVFPVGTELEFKLTPSASVDHSYFAVRVLG